MSLPAFAQVVCVLVGAAFTTQLGSLYLCLTLHFCLPRDQLEVRASCVFPEHTFSPGHMHSPAHVLGLLVSQECVGAFQIPCGHLFPQIILSVFFSKKRKSFQCIFFFVFSKNLKSFQFFCQHVIFLSCCPPLQAATKVNNFL